MNQAVYITSPSSRWPLEYATDEDDAQSKLRKAQGEYPDAAVVTCGSYWEAEKARTMQTFPLSRVTAEFYEDMLGVLPPVFRRGQAGFFVSEAATQSIHAQFIAYNGRHYGGYADISPGGRCWSHADIDVLETMADETTLTLAWYPPDAA